MEKFRIIGKTYGLVMLPVHVTSTLDGYDGGHVLKQCGVIFHGKVSDNPNLRFAELPTGWSISSDLAEGRQINRYNLFDNKKRVCATMQYLRRGRCGLSFHESVGRSWASMTVACPFIVSFRTEGDDKIVARVRRRYGTEIMSLPPVVAKSPHRGQVKAKQHSLMMVRLNEVYPTWRMTRKHWDSLTA